MYMDEMEDDTSGGMDQVKSNFVQYLVIKCIIICELHHPWGTGKFGLRKS